MPTDQPQRSAVQEERRERTAEKKCTRVSARRQRSRRSARVQASKCRRVLNYREEVHVRAVRRQEGERVIQVKRKRESHASEMKEGDVFMRVK